MTTAYIAASLVTPVLYGLVTAALYYLGSRARITKVLWSHYPTWLDAFMLCASCTGFWYGLAASLCIGWWQDLPFLLLPGRLWATPVIVALSSVVLTPYFAALHVRALDFTAAEPVEDQQPVEGTDGHDA